MSEEPSTQPFSPGRGGRGGRSGRGGRGRGSGRDNSRSGQGRNRGNQGGRSKFTGSCDDMKGNVFETHNERLQSNRPTNQYDLTVEALIQYASQKMRVDEAKTQIVRLLQTMEEPIIDRPDDPPSDPTVFETALYEHGIKDYFDQQRALKRGKIALFQIVWGQCSQGMQTRIASLEEYETLLNGGDLLGLLQYIRTVAHNFESHMDESTALCRAMTILYEYKQGSNESNDHFHKKFKANVAVIEKYGGSVGNHPALTARAHESSIQDVTQVVGSTYTSDLALAITAGTQKYLAALFLEKADTRRYGELRRELENDYSRNVDGYPTTLTAAYKLLDTYASPTLPSRHHARQDSTPTEQNTMFVQRQESDESNRFPDITCYNCQRQGHYASNCQEERREVEQQLFMMHGNFCCTTVHDQNVLLQQGPIIDPNWIILDSASTVHMIREKIFLKNIRPAKDPNGCTVHSNGGITVTHQEGDFPGIGTVWYDPTSIANVLSLAKVVQRYRVTQDSSKYAGIRVYLDDGSILPFTKSKGGLYYYDATPPTKTKKTVKAYCLVTTLEENLKNFTRRQRNGIEQAHRVYILVGRPSHDNFLRMISHRQLPNCPVTLDDARNMMIAYGPNTAAIQGKTTRSKPKHVLSNRLVPLEPSILQAHRDVTLAMDIFFVDGLIFLLTVSRNLRFYTIHDLQNRSMANQVLPRLKFVLAMYHARGFRVTEIHADPEFTPLQAVLLTDHGGIHLNVCAANEHVPAAERGIRTVKERNRSTISGLPYKRYPTLLKRAIVKQAAFYMNMLPHHDGVSTVFSPRTIVTGIQTDFDTHCRVPLGQYCEVHDEPSPSNTETKRTTPAIALGPTFQSTTSYDFMSLRSGALITRRRWTEKPITNDVIARVHELARADHDDSFLYEWAPNQPIIPDIPAVPPLTPPREGAENTNERNNIENNNENNNEEIIIEENEQEENENDNSEDEIEENEEQDQEDDQHEELDFEQEEQQDYHENEEHDNEENQNEQDPSHGEYVQDLETQSDEEKSQDLLQDRPFTTVPQRRGYGVLPEPRVNSSRTRRYRRIRAEARNKTQNNQEENEKYVYDLEIVNGLENNEDQIHEENVENEERTHETDQNEEREFFQNEEEEIVFEQSDSIIEEESGEIIMVQDNKSEMVAPIRVRNSSWTNNLSKAIRFIEEKEHVHRYTIDRQETILNMCQVVMTQLSPLAGKQLTVKAGIKAFGMKAIEAIVKEYAQLNDKGVFRPRYFGNLLPEERRKALRAITLVTEKRSGIIKGRTVADGRAQREYTAPESVFSPTVSTEGLMLSLAIDAKENRCVAVADVEGAYLHADMDELVIMVFEGDMVDYMVQADPTKYGPFVHVTKDGRKLLYVELLKALYGCIQSAMLWWKLFTSTLAEDGFTVNPYDSCVANKIMPDGTQCTVCWYVDDLKISHVSEEVVESVISMIEARYGKMSVTRGKKHTYLGMDIEFTGNGEVTILMKGYLEEAITAFPEDCSTIKSTPGAPHLFKTNDKTEKLPEERRELLHSITAKLLYVSKRARPDIQVPISFLTTRVNTADLDDWKKLKRVLQYVSGTLNMPLTLSIDNLRIMKTWVDAAFGTHQDMRSHTGGVIMMGKGALYASSKRQKLNTKSSTEAELVGAGDFLPQALWTANFLKEQGYTVSDSIFYQDNQSAMKMEKNGRQSAGQRSRHIDIRYFFIKDRIKSGDINLIYCPTDEMVADFFTKPLQGYVFIKFRDIVMGITHPSSVQKVLASKARSVLEDMTLYV